MKILRNLFLVLAGLLLLAALVAPGVIAPRVEDIWQQQLANLQGAEATDYQRGWFGAEARTRITGTEGATELHSEIQHGPLLFTASGPRLGAVYSVTTLVPEHLPAALRTQLEGLYGRLAHSPLRLETVVGMDNNIENTLHLESFVRSDAGGELQFEGAELQFQTDYSGAVLDGTVQLGGIRHSAGGREKFYSAPATGELAIVPGCSLEGGLNWPLLKADTESGPLELRQVALNLALTRVDAGHWQWESELAAPQVQSATPVNAVNQRIRIPRATPAVLLHYLAQLVPASGERQWQQVFEPPLAGQQQLQVESANGPITMNADINWRGFRTGARPVSQAPGQWLTPMTGTMTLSAAEPALLQSPLIGQALLLRKYGLLEERDGELQMLLEVDRGELKVNGQPLPPDLFLMAITGQF
ncbi:DUF945 family protein [Microbulbifer guangxiensis]|uniref:DUF945 family protein n=1 Tax=Microbulbifer guangxiensis TaxID=2904249 RepID=UPI001F2FD9C0|nr:DUF945 family protein [Microbulbifer guangxiensis]